MRRLRSGSLGLLILSSVPATAQTPFTGSARELIPFSGHSNLLRRTYVGELTGDRNDDVIVHAATEAVDGFSEP